MARNGKWFSGSSTFVPDQLLLRTSSPPCGDWQPRAHACVQCVVLPHRGVLFLDGLPEFGHTVLEVLRQPLDDKVATISRAVTSLGVEIRQLREIVVSADSGEGFDW